MVNEEMLGYVFEQERGSRLWKPNVQRSIARAMARNGARQTALLNTFTYWAEHGGFMADREPINFTEWNYLRPIYDAVHNNPKDLDLCIMKSAQGGASIFAMLCSIWLALTRRVQIAYYLPTEKQSLKFSGERFLMMARDNAQIREAMGTADDPGDEGNKGSRRFGSSIVHFTYMGGKVSTESLPLDGLIFDEVQVMSVKEMETTLERIAASPLNLVLRLSTANFEGADIHSFYQKSDQRAWYTKCGCAGGVVLVDHWDPKAGPRCIMPADGKVRTEPYFWCPRCEKPIDNVRDGEYRARNPGPKRIGFHFPQFLSPRWSAERTLEAWKDRVDTKNFYNRKLGLPYTDPDTQPINLDLLADAQDTTLRWETGFSRESRPDGVFMGIDQMGHDNRVLIAVPHYDRMRLVHAEIIQDGDPFKRCTQLMKDYRVTVCAVEALPNFNDAHRFAKEHDGKVFVVNYQDLGADMVLWGDRPRDKVATRKTDDEARSQWTATCDQYRMMSWALGQWTGKRVVTPDARTLRQDWRTERGEHETVAVLKDLVWFHLTRIALVTEEIKGREDERKFRRAVRKVGIDPHFAYTWMLLCVAWVRRFGTEFMLDIERDEVMAAAASGEKRSTGAGDQVRAAFPALTTTPAARVAEGLEPETCGTCAYFGGGACKLRGFNTVASFPACDGYLSEIEDD